MIFAPLPIHDSFEISLERRGDTRGFFARTYCKDVFFEHGLNTDWAQMNLSYTAQKGTLRGLHFQRQPAAEVKIVRCLRGQVFDVILDLRSTSPSFGQHIAVQLDGETRNGVYIPIGCAHGFQTLTDDVELQYMHSQTYAPKLEGGVCPTDPILKIQWPLPVTQTSPRDAALPLFADCEAL